MSVSTPAVKVDLDHLLSLTADSRFLFTLADLDYVFKPVSAYHYYVYMDAQARKESANMAQFDLVYKCLISCIHKKTGEETEVTMQYLQELPAGNFTVLLNHLLNASFLRKSG
jgi:hypothetical protein